MKSWYSFKAAADDTAEVSIFDEIGMWGVTAKEFIADLKAQKGKKVTCMINSPGGSVFDALAIYNALRQHGSEITIKIMGIAASAASLIAMAGNKIIMPENTFMMVHNPIGGVYGNAEDMRDLADILDKIGASLTATYVARTGLSEKEVTDLLAAETWLSAEEAVGFGFADELEPALKVAASFETERLPENIKAVFTEASPVFHEDEETPAPAASEPSPGNGDDNAAGDDEVPPGGLGGGEGEGRSATNDSGTGSEDHKESPFADQIAALVAEAGLGDHLGVFLLDASLDTIDKVKAAVDQANEVRALCVAAKLADQAPALIRAKASLADARAKLCDVLAEADESTHTSNIAPTPGGKKPAPSGSAVWAKVLSPANAVH